MSESNNNIPMRITQLEETVQYEDGMFYVVAKAGSGTKKIRADILSPNMSKIQKEVGGTITPAFHYADTIIGTDGTTRNISDYPQLQFYEIDDVSDTDFLTFWCQITNAGNEVHWFNQIDSEGNVLSYDPFYIGVGEGNQYKAVLLADCVRVKFSMWKANNIFKVYYDVPELTERVTENKTAIIELQKKVGGDIVFDYHSVDTIIGTDGTEKSPISGTLYFYGVDDLFGSTSITFTVASKTVGHETHWFNQIDSEGNVLSYVPFYIDGSTGNTVTLNLLPNCAKIKVSMWVDNGDFSIIGSIPSGLSGGKFKLVSALGDSITAGYYYGGWVTNTYQKQIADQLGASFQNLGIGSTPICPNSDYTEGQNDNAFVYRLDTISNDADLIIVAGGTNDFRHNVPLGQESDTASAYETTFYGALDYLLTNIIASHTGKKLVFITPFHQIYDAAPNTAGFMLTDYITAIKKKCEKYGIPCIDGYANSGINLTPAFQNECFFDLIHPNQAGHDLIFRNLMPYFAML